MEPLAAFAELIDSAIDQQTTVSDENVVKFVLTW